jgi:hypothetical protein
LSHAVVVANEPMPSVSKKLTIAPTTSASPLGFVRWTIAARSRTVPNRIIANVIGIRIASSMVFPSAAAEWRKCR